jgi:hypothetical protein
MPTNPTTTKPKVIRPQLGFTRLTDDAFMTRVTTIIKGIDGNAKFPTPPVTAADLKNAADGLSTSMAAALDGSKKAVAEKRQKRTDLTLLLRALGHYVEIASAGDEGTLLSSGYEAASTTRNTTPQPLAQPYIVKVDQGTTGQLLVTAKSVSKARSYDLRYAVVGTGGVIGQYTTVTIPTVKQAQSFTPLPPGTLYTFQVRAYGKLGYTDWSDSVMRMVI